MLFKTHFTFSFLLLTGLFFTSITFAESGEDKEQRDLKEASGIEVGTEAPLFSAIDQAVESFHLEEALEDGPVVMMFYRGEWCPVCSEHLRGVQDSLDLITEKGVEVVAVSPEVPERSRKMAKEADISFSLLHDEDYEIAKAYDVIFRPGYFSRLAYNWMLGADLEGSHTRDSEALPVPATYIINQEGVISWRHFDHDHDERAAVKTILENLP